MKKFGFVVVVTLAVLMAGCISHQAYQGNFANSSTNLTAPGSSQAVPNKPVTTTVPIHKVLISESGFSPSEIHVAPGDIVEFQNKLSDLRLNIGGKVPISKTVFKNQKFQWRFYENGTLYVTTSTWGDSVKLKVVVG